MPSAAAEHARGTAELAPVAFAATDATGEPIACAASIAHWYSVDLGRAAAGETVRVPLWADPASGAVFVLNEKEDRLPVERLWCGFAGRSWATRSTILLERKAGAVPAAISVRCVAEGDRLACR